MFFTLCNAGPSEVRTVGEWLPGARLQLLALVGNKDRYSPKRGKMPNTVTDSPEVSRGCFKSPFFLFRGPVHWAPLSPPSCSSWNSKFQEVRPTFPVSLADNRLSFPSPLAGLWGGETRSCVPCLPGWLSREKPSNTDGGNTCPMAIRGHRPVVPLLPGVLVQAAPRRQ